MAISDGENSVMALLTVQEVPEQLKLHPATVRDYIRTGKIPAAKFGRVWRVSEEDLRAFIEERKRPSAG